MSISPRSIFFFILAIALMGYAALSAYRTYERDRRSSQISREQSDLRDRINALKAEMRTPTNDPAELKRRQDQLNALQNQLDAIKKEIGGLNH